MGSTKERPSDSIESREVQGYVCACACVCERERGREVWL